MLIGGVLVLRNDVKRQSITSALTLGNTIDMRRLCMVIASGGGGRTDALVPRLFSRPSRGRRVSDSSSGMNKYVHTVLDFSHNTYIRTRKIPSVYPAASPHARQTDSQNHLLGPATHLTTHLQDSNTLVFVSSPRTR